MIKVQLKQELEKVLKNLGLPVDKIVFEHPADLAHGDYSSNIAMILFPNIQYPISNINSPIDLAKKIAEEWQKLGLPKFIQNIEVAPPGFLNVWLHIDTLSTNLAEVPTQKEKYGQTTSLEAKKMMVEFAHPNTHKELHIGHMRTLITGEALARIFNVTGASVFRANYQGDIGPHVAKSIWGTLKILEDRGLKIEEVEKWSLPGKAHLLGEGYVKGVQEYEVNKEEIDELNTNLYKKDSSVVPVYEQTRRWCLEYYDTFYSRFGTKFDRLFFESEVFAEGKKIVEENTKPAGKGVFEKSEGAIIFDGEPYDLHKRVFVTSDGNATYEAKDMALAYLQYQTFPFDLNVHVVANEQTGYFQVMIKALETLDPQFKGKEFHLPMGMVQLVGKKMSSRTGVILKVDDLLEEVRKMILPLIKDEGLVASEKDKIAEVLTIAAVKYSILRVSPKQNVLFDLQQSVSLDGDSGPYLEYAFTRTQSVLRKTQKINYELKITNYKFNNEELALLRTFYRYPEIVAEAAAQMAPNLICNFLFDLAQKYNTFYDKWRIITQNGKRKTQNEDEVTQEQSEFRLLLTASVGQVLKNGLNLLGIKSLERM